MPKPTVLLHIGAMKTGTTYIQNLLQSNREQLAAQGWQVPEQFVPVVAGVRQVLGLTDAGKAGLARTPIWDALTDQLRSWDGQGSLVSMEFLSFARPPVAKRIMDGLHGTDVHVILTVRDAAGAMASQWQSYVRNGGAVSWPDFARDVRIANERRPEGTPPPAATPASKTFRRTQAIPRMLRVWSALLPPERLTVVTVPPSSAPRDLLWRRLLSVGRIDPDATVMDSSAFDNPRLGYGSCDLLRRLNGAGLKDVRPSSYRRVMRPVTREYLLPLRDEESRPRLDRATARVGAELNGRTRALVEERATLVGDLEELPTRARHAKLDPGEQPTQVPEVEVARAAEATRTGMLAYYRERRLELPTAESGRVADDLDIAVFRLAALMKHAMESPVESRDGSRAAQPRMSPQA